MQLDRLWWEAEMRADPDPVSVLIPSISASGILFLVLRVTFHQIIHLGILQLKFW